MIQIKIPIYDGYYELLQVSPIAFENYVTVILKVCVVDKSLTVNLYNFQFASTASHIEENFAIFSRRRISHLFC